MPLQEYFHSDIRFYYAVGGFIIAVYLVGIIGITIVNPTSLDGRTLIPLTGGFFLFMFVYFISISVQLLEEKEL
ncbi:hypothetical protein [Natrialba taiwanensis]|uniref:Uncharacterized protein n=1 Tax=Natrialba taiwanensis DSM 12281 TaxID=1230458 RepID=M0A566_9EURY|nr:hypothetical protein [Natrialba taiwanensis]ELY93714.1 hypothetical protein C484_07526 [Natrialba taiwanensis DSM 12281]